MVDLTGQKFGRLTAIKPTEKRCGHCIGWECHCDCGNRCIVGSAMLRIGNTQSCGCLHKEGLAKRNTKHGMSRTKMYWTWGDMVSRCKNLQHHAYKNYGGRGISVCDRWLKFENFLKDMGEKPNPMLTLERINNDNNYEPKNCKWATRKEQRNNQRDSKNQKWFFAYNKNTGEWDEDNNQYEFAKRHFLHTSGVGRCCRGKQKQTMGWIFKYLEV